jgi:hypothetical protein
MLRISRFEAAISCAGEGEEEIEILIKLLKAIEEIFRKFK